MIYDVGNSGRGLGQAQHVTGLNRLICFNCCPCILDILQGYLRWKGQDIRWCFFKLLFGLACTEMQYPCNQPMSCSKLQTFAYFVIVFIVFIVFIIIIIIVYEGGLHYYIYLFLIKTNNNKVPYISSNKRLRTNDNCQFINIMHCLSTIQNNFQGQHLVRLSIPRLTLAILGQTTMWI